MGTPTAATAATAATASTASTSTPTVCSATPRDAATFASNAASAGRPDAVAWCGSTAKGSSSSASFLCKWNIWSFSGWPTCTPSADERPSKWSWSLSCSAIVSVACSYPALHWHARLHTDLGCCYIEDDRLGSWSCALKSCGQLKKIISSYAQATLVSQVYRCERACALALIVFRAGFT